MERMANTQVWEAQYAHRSDGPLRPTISETETFVARSVHDAVKKATHDIDSDWSVVSLRIVSVLTR